MGLRGLDAGRESAGRGDAHPLCSPCISCHYSYLRLGYAAQLAEEGAQRLVSLAIHRGGGQANLEGVAMGPGDFIFGRSRLNSELEDEILTIPSIPHNYPPS